jgi:hypothetical protein
MAAAAGSSRLAEELRKAAKLPLTANGDPGRSHCALLIVRALGVGVVVVVVDC